MTESEHVKLGAYHTLELELQRAFSLHKVRRPASPAGLLGEAPGEGGTGRWARGCRSDALRDARAAHPSALLPTVACPAAILSAKGCSLPAQLHHVVEAPHHACTPAAALARLECHAACLPACLARPTPTLACHGEPRHSTPLQDSWDSVDVERVRTACDPAASADLAVLLITVGAFTRIIA